MLKQNLDKVFAEIEKGNCFGEPVTLVGATKTMPIETINEAVSLGLKVVAENKAQEFNFKHDYIVGARQHFIGHLQTNKVKYLVGKVELIHSVDSVHLAEAIDICANKKGVVQDVLIEVNVGGELSKSGFSPENVIDNALYIAENFSGVRVRGLMAMLPHSDDVELLTSLCKKMRALYDNLKEKGLPFTYLSMGMSGDYMLAVKNGSNMIRLGRTIFGERNYGDKH